MQNISYECACVPFTYISLQVPNAYMSDQEDMYLVVTMWHELHLEWSRANKSKSRPKGIYRTTEYSLWFTPESRNLPELT